MVRSSTSGASFRCDLAIKTKGGSDYDLAILIDGGVTDEARKVYERYGFKPAILRAFGWRVIDVPSHAWRSDRSAVLETIERALDPEFDHSSDDDPFENIPAPAQVSVPATKPAESASDQLAPLSDGDWQSFQFKRGNSDKFWRIALRGTDVVVNYGRSGTKGQSVTKSYDDEAQAKREMNKLILEKTRKGYLET